MFSGSTGDSTGCTDPHRKSPVVPDPLPGRYRWEGGNPSVFKIDLKALRRLYWLGVVGSTDPCNPTSVVPTVVPGHYR